MRIVCWEIERSCVVTQLQQNLLIVAIARLFPGRSSSGVISAPSGKVNKQLKEKRECEFFFFFQRILLHCRLFKKRKAVSLHSPVLVPIIKLLQLSLIVKTCFSQLVGCFYKPFVAAGRTGTLASTNNTVCKRMFYQLL